jgi:hypothetical protein
VRERREAMLCKVCKNEVPKKGALVVLSANLLRGKSFVMKHYVVYEDHESSEVNDLVCGKKCALAFMSKELDRMLGGRPVFAMSTPGGEAA